MSARLLPAAVLAVGGTAITTCAAAILAAGEPTALLPVALAAAWWVAGLIAVSARPDYGSARLLAGFGLLHLVAFALSTVVGSGSADGLGLGVSPVGAWTTWGLSVAASIAYDLGFAVLAILLATFPAESARLSRVGLVAMALAVVVAVVAAVTSDSVDLPLHVQRPSVPVPAPLPIGSAMDLSPLLPLLVVGALVLLLRRTWRASGDTRRQLLWPAAVTCVLAVLLVATPAGTHLLGRGWALVFVPIVAALPFALLAGMRRFRLLQVELYAARTLGYAGVLAVLVAAYAGVAALVGKHSVGAAMTVAAVAAVTGHPLRTWLEAGVDRIASGGRVRGHAVVRQLAESLENTDAQRMAERSAQTIASGLEVSWVCVVCPPVLARAGQPEGAPAVTVALLASGAPVGSIECGPRRGGWSSDDVHLLELLGRHAGLALHDAELRLALTRQVEELHASRERLVRAEDEARRRIERDLHDGLQQQLVVLLSRLGLLHSQLDTTASAASLAVQSREVAQQALDDLRSLVRGIHPPLLTDRGLVAAVEARADLLTLPVTVDADPRLESQRFALEVETAAYYVVSEAVTNAMKHSGSARIRVVLTPIEPAGLQVAVVDEGSGFVPAQCERGSGLRGLRDRVEAVGGVLEVLSSQGVGTTVTARFRQRMSARA